MTHEVKYHCTSCLDGRHVCSVMIPLHWEGATEATKCVCRRCCDKRYAAHIVEPGKTVRPPILPERKHVPNPRGRPISKWTDDKMAELLRLQAQGLSSKDIGERVGAKPDVVRHYIKRARARGVTV